MSTVPVQVVLYGFKNVGGDDVVRFARVLSLTDGMTADLYVFFRSGDLPQTNGPKQINGIPYEETSGDPSPFMWTTVKTSPDALVLNVVDFGADPTGVAISTQPINACIAEAVALTQVVNFGAQVSSGSSPTVFFPKGVYKIDDDLTFAGGMEFISFEGNQSIIHQIDASKNIFSGVKYNNSFSHLVLLNGARGVFIETSNLGGATVNIDDCEFQDQAVACIASDGNSYSTSIVVSRCKLANQNTGANVGRFLTGDMITFSECFVGIDCTTVFFVGDGTSTGQDGGGSPQLRLINMLGSPATLSGGEWVYLDGGCLYADGCRFGGENGGKTIVNCHTTTITSGTPATEVIVKNSACYSSLQYAFKFSHIPNVFQVDGCWGFVSSLGCLFDSGSLTTTDTHSMGNTSNFSITNTDLPVPLDENNGLNPDYVVSQAINAAQVDKGSYLLTSDKALTIPAGDNTDYGYNQFAQGVTVGSQAGLFHGNRIAITVTDPGCLYELRYDTALGAIGSNIALPPGTYTFVIEFKVSVHPIEVQLTYGDNAKLVSLEVGTHVVSLPFQLEGTVSEFRGLRCDFLQAKVGTILAIDTFRVFIGNTEVDTSNTVVFGPAIPTSQRWQAGDQIQNSAPAAAGNIGWVCTTAGTASNIAWANTHAYLVGNIVNNGGNVYRCITAGTSAGSGGPTGTGTNIVDGTVHWIYLDPLPVFKTFGAIAA